MFLNQGLQNGTSHEQGVAAGVYTIVGDATDSSKRFEHFLNLIYASATFDVGFLESTKFLIQKWIALQSVVNLQNEVIKNIYQICAIYFLSIAIYL